MDTTTSGVTAGEAIAILAIALDAARADARAESDEGERLAAIEARLRLWQFPRTGAPGGREAASPIVRHEARLLAWNVAVGACSADGLRRPRETLHLATLAGRLGLTQPEIGMLAATADGLATVVLAPPPGSSGGSPSADALEGLVIEAAVRCGALGALCDAMALLAVIAMQWKLVHRLLGARGVDADRDACRRCALQAGAGAVAQYLEAIALWLLPAWQSTDGSVDANSTIAGLGASSRFAFATTFALGQCVRGQDAQGNDGVTFGDWRRRGHARFALLSTGVEARRASLHLDRLVSFVREF